MVQDDIVVDLADLVVARDSGDVRFRLEVPVFQLRQGERVAIAGPSGCGKSTLLDCLGLLVRPTSLGLYRLSGHDGRRYDAASDLLRGRMDGCARTRSTLIGYVPQIGGLIPALTVERNISIARDIAGQGGNVLDLLAQLGLRDHRRKRPDALSVGERQRVAIGRALIHHPVLLIADEPTSALDPVTADRVLGLMIEQAQARGAAVIIATHDVDRAVRHGFIPVQRHTAKGRDGIVSLFKRAA